MPAISDMHENFIYRKFVQKNSLQSRKTGLQAICLDGFEILPVMLRGLRMRLKIKRRNKTVRNL